MSRFGEGIGLIDLGNCVVGPRRGHRARCSQDRSWWLHFIDLWFVLDRAMCT